MAGSFQLISIDSAIRSARIDAQTYDPGMRGRLNGQRAWLLLLRARNRKD